MKLDIQGQQVEVDDSFAKLSPEDQAATVEDISNQMGIHAEKKQEVQKEKAETSQPTAWQDFSQQYPTTAKVAEVPFGIAAGAAAAATPALLGDEIAESIFAAVAAIQLSDANGDVYVALNPTNYSYLVQSGKAVNADYTSSNGGFDTGKVMKVGGANVVMTNNLPATAGLIALAFTAQAAGMVELWSLNTAIDEQEDFLGAKLVSGSCCDGVGVLRPNCAVSIKNV